MLEHDYMIAETVRCATVYTIKSAYFNHGQLPKFANMLHSSVE